MSTPLRCDYLRNDQGIAAQVLPVYSHAVRSSWFHNAGNDLP